ncbi:MAG: prepilin-type N-terminal cleavage/methylation domain-containing protein [Deltaproteobacteria bacterium]|jgi:type IV pilus assembly protein PilA|nr:prepilin-type N-terminal cleavage/methylation domain-containing protein [Deltaproteobacteria bacterium]
MKRPLRNPSVTRLTDASHSAAGNAEKGFTLFELLIAVAIIGILAAVSIPRFSDYRAAAFDSRAQQDLRNVASAQELHHATSDTYAAATADLAGFSSSPGVVMAIASADASAFVASASHPGGKNVYSWDSAAQPAMSSAPQAPAP